MKWSQFKDPQLPVSFWLCVFHAMMKIMCSEKHVNGNIPIDKVLKAFNLNFDISFIEVNLFLSHVRRFLYSSIESCNQFLIPQTS